MAYGDEAKGRAGMKYTVSDDSTIRVGTARDILQEIINKGGNEEISRMSIDQYADALLDNAEYYLSEDVIKILKGIRFGTKYDQALKYLSAMPASGARILDEEREDTDGVGDKERAFATVRH